MDLSELQTPVLHLPQECLPTARVQGPSVSLDTWETLGHTVKQSMWNFRC